VNPSPDPLHPRLEHGFIVLTANPDDPRNERFQAWLYEGPLDFDQAQPLCFGTGPTLNDSLTALTLHLPPESAPGSC
jgi:hypothetical protein